GLYRAREGRSRRVAVLCAAHSACCLNRRRIPALSRGADLAIALRLCPHLWLSRGEFLRCQPKVSVGVRACEPVASDHGPLLECQEIVAVLVEFAKRRGSARHHFV